jgi:hypothetical protein
MNRRTWLLGALSPLLLLACCSPAGSKEVQAAEPTGTSGAPAIAAPVAGEASARSAPLAQPEPAAPVEALETPLVLAEEPAEPEAHAAPDPAPEQPPPAQALSQETAALPVQPVAAAPTPASATPAGSSATRPQADDPRLAGMLVFERGEGRMPVLVARDEELTMNVRVRLGLAGSPRLGTVVMRSKVVPNRGSVLVQRPTAEAKGERAELTAEAQGGNSLYHLHEIRKSLLLPQDWPRIKHTSVQTGTENRMSEQEIGRGEQGHRTRFRGDHHCRGCQLQQHFVEPTWAWQDPQHCKKCKRAEHRVWREWQERELPEGSVDMVTAVTLGRSMLLLGEREMTFPLIDKEELWELTVRTGRSERIEVDAGSFDATEILLETRPAPGEDAKPEDFKGLFGIHGTVSIWFDTRTGVPVRISGSVPLGPFTLDARVELASYRGTPAGFEPVE